jgi:hypothetical protein
MAFERTEDYMLKITMDALDEHVILDADVRFEYEGRKLKAYCPQTSTYLQFPRDIRRAGLKMIADVVKDKRKNGREFYRAYKGSIRETKCADPVA